MPRPTAAQFAYGALTVVFATLAMLLLSQARSATGIGVVAVAALGLGLLVALGAAPRTVSGTPRATAGPRAAGPPADTAADTGQPRHGHENTLCTTGTSRRH